MASFSTSLDSITQDIRQFVSSGNQSNPNPRAALAKELTSSVQQNKQQQTLATLPEPQQEQEETKKDFVRVTSSLGKAASSGQLSRQEAVAIYREIANLL
jgi:hypothetical protein